jgi:protease I
MNAQLLAGKKIGVLVESLYIPEEIAAYQQDFAGLGAEVHLMSRLWGNPTLTFWSDANGTDHIERLEVSIDFEHMRLEEYAAIIMAANYTSVRLRYFQPPEQPQDAPAVRFFANAMRNPRIVKGALCHGLWILTPHPELLQGRRIICHEVVRADVLNAGALFTPSPTNVVVDHDLVTGHSKDDVHRFIQAIAEQVQALQLVPQI